MEWTEILFFIATGCFAGFLSGLFGVGGGFITFPVLFYALPAYFAPQDRILIAVATSLAVTSVATVVSTAGHLQKRAVDFATLRMFLGGLMLGCVIGPFLAQRLPESFLRSLFAAICLLLGGSFLFPRLPRLSIAKAPNHSLNAFGLAIGILSSLLGIGGGILSVPVLLGYHLPMQRAIGTSSAATLVTVWTGSIGYLILGRHRDAYPGVYGFVDLHAFLFLALGVILTAHFGVIAAHRLPVAQLKRVFGMLLIAVGLVVIG